MAQLKSLPNPLPENWPTNLHVDHATGTQTLIPYSLDEYNQWVENSLIDAERAAADAARPAELEAEAKAKAAILDRLGLTAEEAALLLK